MHKLDIIIPYYNCKLYTDELLRCLSNQITKDIGVILIDDGSKVPYKTNYDWVKVIRKENGGVSSARNVGLDNCNAKYVAFIDSDDLVSNKYISTILKTIESNPDYIYLSWKTLPGNGWQSGKKLETIDDKFDPWNCCVWSRIYKRSVIGDIRFNENKQIAEDAEFIRAIGESNLKKAFISEYMYYYRSDAVDSLTKRFAKGEVNTQRFVIHYDYISKNMGKLVDTVRELNKLGEVIVMTNRNELPELENYAMVMQPTMIKGTKLIGEPTPLFTLIKLPIKTQVVLYTSQTFALGGIETFIYSFCMNMKDIYDIMVLYDYMDIEQVKRLEPYVCVRQNNSTEVIECDTIIVNRITDVVPQNVKYKKKIQMVHCCRLVPYWTVPTNCDNVVTVSSVVDKTYPEIKNKSTIIQNFTYPTPPKKILQLISGTRLTFEKGEDRMIKFAKTLNKYGVKFIWYMFSDRRLKVEIPNVVYMSPTLDFKDYVNMCDYLVQFSDSEAFCYSIVEALEMGVPVLTTPISVLSDIGMVDGENGYVLPFDMGVSDEVVEKIVHNIPQFTYSHNNEIIKEQWKEILGDTVPKGDYVYIPNSNNDFVTIKILNDYNSCVLNRLVRVGEILTTTRERAEMIVKIGCAKIL